MARWYIVHGIWIYSSSVCKGNTPSGKACVYVGNTKTAPYGAAV